MKKFTYEVVNDESPLNPRTEWDNTTTMICFHNRYNLGDKHDFKSRDYDSWEEMEQAIRNHYEVLALKPLYLYDHSGITISTSPFGCNFDSGRIGFIIVDKDKLQNMTGDADGHSLDYLEEVIDSEVKTYDQYLTGEVYGYRTFEIETCSLGCEHKTELDSCWGYYSEDEAESEAKAMISHYEKENALA